MNDTYLTANQWANAHRQDIERRARSSPGAFLSNLAHQWMLFLVREIPL